MLSISIILVNIAEPDVRGDTLFISYAFSFASLSYAPGPLTLYSSEAIFDI